MLSQDNSKQREKSVLWSHRIVSIGQCCLHIARNIKKFFFKSLLEFVKSKVNNEKVIQICIAYRKSYAVSPQKNMVGVIRQRKKIFFSNLCVRLLFLCTIFIASHRNSVLVLNSHSFTYHLFVEYISDS